MTYSNIEGGYTGTGNIDSDPLFTQMYTGDYTLSDYSPSLGAGTSSGAPDEDIDGNIRPNPSDSNPDMGAYESPLGERLTGNTYYVATTGSDSSFGFSSDPFLTIQHGIDAAWMGDTLLVLPGTYVENIDYNGKSIVLGSQLLTTGDTSYVSSTIINGNVTIDNAVDSTAVLTGFTIRNSSSRGVTCSGDPTISNLRVKGHTGGGMSFSSSDLSLSHVEVSNNTYNGDGAGIYITSSSLDITGVTVDGNRTGESSNYEGGGFYIDNSTVVMDSVIVSDNYAGGYGGGLYLHDYSDVAIANSSVVNDTASYYGGGIYSTNTTLSLNNVQVDSNQVGQHGGGLFMNNDTLTAVNTTFNYNTSTNSNYSGGGMFLNSNGSYVLDECYIQNNTADKYGGGVYCSEGSPVFTNVLITDNVLTGSSTNGGGVYTSNSSADPVFTNVTIANNTADIGGGYYRGSGDPTFINTIIWYNTAASDPSINNVGSGSVTYSNIEGGYTGDGNIDSDPMFIDASASDYHLTWGSPCIDAGDPNSPHDPDGTRIDMGAFYYDQTDTTAPTINITELSSTNIGTKDELTIHWVANDNYSLDSAFVDMFYSENEVYRVDTTSAESGLSTISIPDSTLNSFHIVVRVLDESNNESQDTSDVVTVFDNTSPQAIVLTPTTGTSIPEYEELSVTWEATDNIEMDSVAVYFSNADEFVYQGKVQYEEVFSFVVPFGVTDSAQVKLIAQDIFGNTGEDTSGYFSVTDNTPPTIEVEIPGNTELIISDNFSIAWSATDNVSVTEINIAYSVDVGSFTDIATGVENEGEYEWLVPNEPSDNVSLRLIAIDEVGLTDTSIVSGLSIIIVYPYVVQVLPEVDLLSLRETGISIQFSQLIDSTTITTDNIQFESKFTDEVTSDLEYNSSEKTLHINVTTGLASMDSIFVTLIGSNLTNLFGYPLDANNDGEIGEDVILSFATQLLADYDTTGAVDFYDLNQFVSAWYAKDYFYELGPAAGTVPHLIPTYDEQYNIEDLATFLRMWNWSYSFSQPLTKELVTDGLPSTFGFEDNRLIMTLPETDEIVSSIRVAVSCLDAEIEINSTLEDEFTFALVRDWKDVAIKELSLARTNLNDSLKTVELMHVNGDRNLVYIDLSYEVLNPDGFIVSRGYKSLEYIPLPSDYILYPAYPNPFNPVAIIEFGLPIENNASVVIYDITGREVTRIINKFLPAGYHKVKWVAHNQASGIYFVRMISGEFIKVQKIMLIK